MREIPLIFPIALLLIVATLVFSATYTLASNAVDKNTTGSEYDWHENTAIWVCPFH